MSDSSLIKLQALRTATLLKRDVEPQVFSREFSELFKSTYFVEDLWTAGSETQVLLYKNIFFKEHLQWLLLTVLGSSLQLYSLKETQRISWQRCLFVNFAKFSRISSDRTHSDDCICAFWEVFQITPFIGHLWEKLLISCTSCRISTTRYNMNISQLLFKHLIQEKDIALRRQSFT